VQANVEVGETYIVDVAKIEVDLQTIIEMIVEQKIIILVSMQEQDNEDEHVITHVDIDVGEILNLICPTHPLYLRGSMGFFFKFAIPSLIVVLKILPRPSFSM